MANIYGVFDGETMLFSGTAIEVAKQYDLYDRASVYNLVKNNWLLQRRYAVKFLRKAMRHLEEKPKAPKPTKQEIERQEHLDNIIAMLKIHGATFVKDRDEWRTDLRKAGIKYRSIKWENGYRLEKV